MPSGAAIHRVHQVLVVDDSPEVLEATATLLRVHGCDVATASSGHAAFQAFERGLRPCMMLLDLRMPEMDGWEVWNRMRAHEELQATPVVIVSGEFPDPARARARAVGIRAFLQKPRPGHDIVDAVERHCRMATP
jgi:CheY-like chemotaxis protein